MEKLNADEPVEREIKSLFANLERIYSNLTELDNQICGFLLENLDDGKYETEHVADEEYSTKMTDAKITLDIAEVRVLDVVGLSNGTVGNAWITVQKNGTYFIPQPFGANSGPPQGFHSFAFEPQLYTNGVCPEFPFSLSKSPDLGKECQFIKSLCSRSSSSNLTSCYQGRRQNMKSSSSIGVGNVFFKKTAQEMDLKPVEMKNIIHSVFGGSPLQKQDHRLYEIILQNVNSGFSFDISVLDQPIICGKIPRINKGIWEKEEYNSH
ncbi:hypothetical protein TNIN_482471 [Trichonephila inaurata madagascariensis]|uniref:Uncharacterized protein n=1 Tax=Trichonephila inaurata madagascariensis TaxID=2747483 RepID=A0A8X6X9P0_9ARAC|nr:hypothetical protein TNIN_482471 [Trichonephila inaurata madagascariensis]